MFLLFKGAMQTKNDEQQEAANEFGRNSNNKFLEKKEEVYFIKGEIQCQWWLVTYTRFSAFWKP